MFRSGNRSIVPAHARTRMALGTYLYNGIYHMAYNKRSAPLLGFTLIELLVVISIIALLVGILLPALGAARQTAQSIVCMSANRQIGLSATSYAGDNREYFVRYREVWGGGFPPGMGSLWTSTLYNGGYMPDLKGYTCPTIESNNEILEADPEAPHSEKWLYPDIGMNSSNIGSLQRQLSFPSSLAGMVYSGIVSSGPSKGTPSSTLGVTPRISDVIKSSQMICFADAVDKGKQFTPGVGLQDYERGSLFVFDYADASSRFYGRPHARHKLGLNLTFADGHAESLKLSTGDVNPKADAVEMYGSADPTQFEDNELSDARYHENNRWTVDGKPKPGQL